jgi:hypothetical protein
MPVWLIPLLLNIWKVVWHAICRFWSVFLVGLVITLVLVKFGAFKNTIYNKGYQSGYSQALTDHPQTHVDAGGTANTYVNPIIKTLGIEIDGFGLGFFHRR